MSSFDRTSPFLFCPLYSHFNFRTIYFMYIGSHSKFLGAFVRRQFVVYSFFNKKCVWKRLASVPNWRSVWNFLGFIRRQGGGGLECSSYATKSLLKKFLAIIFFEKQLGGTWERERSKLTERMTFLEAPGGSATKCLFKKPFGIKGYFKQYLRVGDGSEFLVGSLVVRGSGEQEMPPRCNKKFI